MKTGLLLLCAVFTFFSCSQKNSNDISGSWQLPFHSEQSKVHLTLYFHDNNNFNLEAFEGAVTIRVEGTYFLKGDTFLIKDRIHEPHQICDYSDTGKYTYRRNKDSLFFRAIYDKCEKRKFVLSSGLVLRK